jgi:hypothetical protein
MNMSVLVHMPADAMREHARHAASAHPVAARIERRWAAIGSLVATLIVLAVFFAH